MFLQLKVQERERESCKCVRYLAMLSQSWHEWGCVGPFKWRLCEDNKKKNQHIVWMYENLAIMVNLNDNFKILRLNSALILLSVRFRTIKKKKKKINSGQQSIKLCSTAQLK